MSLARSIVRVGEFKKQTEDEPTPKMFRNVLSFQRNLAITRRVPRAFKWDSVGSRSLVWIDTEMTGLDIEKDTILEVPTRVARYDR